MKTFMIIMFLTITMGLSAHDINMEMGYLPGITLNLPVQPVSSTFKFTSLVNEVMYVDFGGHFVQPIGWGISAFIGGDVNTFILPLANKIGFFPFFEQYTFDTGIRWNDVTIGYSHICEHPADPLLYASGNVPLFIADGAMDKVYVKFHKDFQ